MPKRAGICVGCLIGAVLLFSSTGPLKAADELVFAPLDRADFGTFVRSLNIKPYGYKLVPDPTGKAPTEQVERFEVRAGDCHAFKGWSDCAKDRERSELSEKGTKNVPGTTSWYGWWFYLPPDWPNIYPAKTVLGQFHQHGAHPVWMFLNTPAGLVLDDQTLGRTTRLIPLIDAPQLAGRWHQIEVEAKWAKGEKGLLRVFVNGDLRFTHKGTTMTGQSVYFRYGIYRSFVSRYHAAKGIKRAPTQVSLFSAVRKATKREDLKPRSHSR